MGWTSRRIRRTTPSLARRARSAFLHGRAPRRTLRPPPTATTVGDGPCVRSPSTSSPSPASLCPPSSCGGTSGRATPPRCSPADVAIRRQEVWFMAWPAWAIAHLHSVFFSGAVNVPHGANLLSNTSGPLVGVLLAPVTWTFGPVAATNVALDARPGAECVGLFRRGPPSDQLEAGRHSGSAGLRLLVRHRHVDRLRPRVRHRVGDPTVPLHLAARDRDPPGALGPTRRAPPGRAPRRAVLHIARDPGDVPRPRTRRPGGGRGGRLAPAAAAGRARAAQPGARRRRDRGCAGVPRLVRIGRAPSGVGGVVRAGADLRGAALGPARTGGVRRGGRPATSASVVTWAATARRPTTSAGGSLWLRWVP